MQQAGPTTRDVQAWGTSGKSGERRESLFRSPDVNRETGRLVFFLVPDGP